MDSVNVQFLSISMYTVHRTPIPYAQEGYVEVWDLETRECMFALTDEFSEPLLYDKSNPNVCNSKSLVLAFTTTLPCLDDGSYTVYTADCK